VNEISCGPAPDSGIGDDSHHQKLYSARRNPRSERWRSPGSTVPLSRRRCPRHLHVGLPVSHCIMYLLFLLHYRVSLSHPGASVGSSHPFPALRQYKTLRSATRYAHLCFPGCAKFHELVYKHMWSLLLSRRAVNYLHLYRHNSPNSLKMQIKPMSRIKGHNPGRSTVSSISERKSYGVMEKVGDVSRITVLSEIAFLPGCYGLMKVPLERPYL
jgi:hypothetical protein